MDAALQTDDVGRDPASEAVVQTAPQPLQSVPQSTITPNPSTPGGPQYQQMTQTPVSDQSQQFKSGEQADEIKPSRWDKWAAGWDLQSNKMPVGLPGSDEAGAIPRWVYKEQQQDLSDQNNAPNLTADEANKMYPGRPEPYAAPVSQWVAQMEFNDRQRIQKIQDWKNAGGATPFTDLAQGLAGGFVDPLNLALMTAMGPLSKLAGLGEVTGAAKFATRLGENFGINAATGAISYAQEKSEGLDPSAWEATKQAAEGALGGTIFHTVVIDPMKLAWDAFRKTSIETQARIIKEVVSSNDRNTTPTLEAQNTVLEQRKAGAIQDGQNIRRITPLEANPTQFYAGADSQGNKATFVDGLGEGTQVHSNSDVVNNAVSNPEGKSPGRVGETKLPEGTKLLDLDQPMPKELVDQAQAELKKNGVDDLFSRSQLEAASGKEILDLLEKLPTQEDGYNSSDVMRARVDAEGYTGYSFMDKAPDGTAIGKVAHLFDENMPITGEESQANPDVTPKITPDQQTALDQAQGDKSASVYSDPETDKEVHDLRHGEVLNSKADYMDEFTKNIEDQAKAELTKLGETSESAKAGLEELKRMTADGKQQSAMAKTLADCVESGLS